MTDLPRYTLRELDRLDSLGRSMLLVVEGERDKRFFSAWALQEGVGQGVMVMAIDEVQVDDQDVEALGLKVGNRSRVMALARFAEQEAVDVVCVADRDTGQFVEEFQHSTLVWTDYPSIESYAMDKVVLQSACLVGFNGALPEIDELHRDLAWCLRELFAVRQHHPHLAQPAYSKAITKGSLSEFDVGKAVGPQIAARASEYERSESPDSRTFSYGHDIAGLLLAGFANRLKNRAGLTTRDAVEGALLSAVLALRIYSREGLFMSLTERASQRLAADRDHASGGAA